MTTKLKRNAAPPPFKGGLDWEAIARQRQERLEAEAARGVEDAVLELLAESSGVPVPAPKKKSRKVENARPVHDEDEVIRLYVKEKLSMSEIARRLQAHRSTIHRILQRRDALGETVGGRRRSDLCGRGLHSMEDAYEVKGGGRACRHCKTDRARERKARLKAASPATV